MRNINGVRVSLMGGATCIPRRAYNLIANWNTDGSAELAGAQICEAFVYPDHVRLYASGYYTGRPGCWEIHRMAFDKPRRPTT